MLLVVTKLGILVKHVLITPNSFGRYCCTMYCPFRYSDTSDDRRRYLSINSCISYRGQSDDACYSRKSTCCPNERSGNGWNELGRRALIIVNHDHEIYQYRYSIHIAPRNAVRLRQHISHVAFDTLYATLWQVNNWRNCDLCSGECPIA